MARCRCLSAPCMHHGVLQQSCILSPPRRSRHKVSRREFHAAQRTSLCCGGRAGGRNHQAGCGDWLLLEQARICIAVIAFWARFNLQRPGIACILESIKRAHSSASLGRCQSVCPCNGSQRSPCLPVCVSGSVGRKTCAAAGAHTWYTQIVIGLHDQQVCAGCKIAVWRGTRAAYVADHLDPAIPLCVSR